jgi:hypothetical protein
MRTLNSSALILSLCCALATLGPAHADTLQQAPGMDKVTSPASSSEQQFISSVTRDLQHRLGTTAQAKALGYFRYTIRVNNVVSWVNPNYWKSDAKHPGQLLYDTHGKLLAAYFSIPKADSKTTPDLWGMSASRWTSADEHVHFGVNTASGIRYGFVAPQHLAQIGGSVTNPVPEDIVKLGKAKSVSDVAFVFHFPASYVVQMWLVPNTQGSFAFANPGYGAVFLTSCRPTDSEPSLWMTPAMYRH